MYIYVLHFCIHMYVYRSNHIFIHESTYVCVHACMYMYMYVYAYEYTYKSWFVYRMLYIHNKTFCNFNFNSCAGWIIYIKLLDLRLLWVIRVIHIHIYMCSHICESDSYESYESYMYIYIWVMPHMWIMTLKRAMSHPLHLQSHVTKIMTCFMTPTWWCSVLQCVAVCCRVMSHNHDMHLDSYMVLQCVAVCCSVSHVTQSWMHLDSYMSYITLMTWCRSHDSALQCFAVCCRVMSHNHDMHLDSYMVLQCVAVCCSVLQCVAESRHTITTCIWTPTRVVSHSWLF